SEIHVSAARSSPETPWITLGCPFGEGDVYRDRKMPMEDDMSVTGLHALIYTPAVEDLRTLLTDAFGFSHVDAGERWLIYALPPAELGVHPASAPHCALSFMCDDLT